ncbi:MAG: hypothetical protein IMZ53_13845, partial [Thermoplasmata archaeon]|nr:hypothetical protein [Thermoplasmata archaeon]
KGEKQKKKVETDGICCIKIKKFALILVVACGASFRNDCNDPRLHPFPVRQETIAGRDQAYRIQMIQRLRVGVTVLKIGGIFLSE